VRLPCALTVYAAQYRATTGPPLAAPTERTKTARETLFMNLPRRAERRWNRRRLVDFTTTGAVPREATCETDQADLGRPEIFARGRRRFARNASVP